MSEINSRVWIDDGIYIKELQEENARLRDALDNLIELIEHETDLPRSAANGITDQTGQIDQGVVMATTILDEAREALSGRENGNG